MRFQVLVPIALAASADAAMAFAPSSSFTPAARSAARACGAAAPAAPRLRPAALKMAETEEISQAEYEELLRLAGRGPAEPAAAAQPAAKQGGGGLFGMFGGGGGAAAAPKAAAPAAAAAPPAAAGEWQEIFDETYQAPYWWNVNTGETTWDKPAARAAPAAPPPKPAAAKPAARSGGGLISPGNPVKAKPKPAAKPRVQQAALFDDEDYMSELPPVSAGDKPQLQKTEQRPAEPTPTPAAAAPAAAAPSGGGGGFFGGLFGGGQKAAPAAAASSAPPGKEEVSEAELRKLMEAAGKSEISGYSLEVPPGRQAGYKQVKKVVEPNASPASMAPAPVNTGVTDLGGVKVTTIRAGDKRNFPQPGDTLTMHYVGKLRDTKQVFDSSIARGQPFQFTIGQGMVIRGWDEGILKMSLGEKAQLVILSDYGYGATGQGAIPPNADLVFDVDLLAINNVKASGRFSGAN